MKTALGIDPGIGNTGWAIVKRAPSGYQLVRSGYSKTSTKEPFGERLDSQYVTIYDRLIEYEPDICAIESAYFNRNISSHNSTISVIAVAEFAAYRLNVPALQIKPQIVKASVGCSMNANKDAVRCHVNRILKCEIKNHHESDAVAVAVAALLKGGVK